MQLDVVVTPTIPSDDMLHDPHLPERQTDSRWKQSQWHWAKAGTAAGSTACSYAGCMQCENSYKAYTAASPGSTCQVKL